mmetsp:Transcript_64101/g.181990  ORF Transcript_64101/g.181990 Transcript_64101/m.181990 type:complete len:215 (-) Transcript_64101:249-893(-)
MAGGGTPEVVGAAAGVGLQHRGAAYRAAQATPDASVTVEIATARMANEDETLVRRVVEMVNRAYGHRRTTEAEVHRRIALSNKGTNRVLHLAYRGDTLVGCCSSTIQPPWTCYGCGHWGLMVVDRAAQGSGVASALVEAAEQRLAQAGCSRIQIEYEYTTGDPFSDRLMQWYEGKLGFSCMTGRPWSRQPGHHEFRICHKRIKQGGCCCTCVVS